MLTERVNTTKQENGTMDVARQGCFNSFNAIACARTSSLGILVTITGILCLARVLKLHLEKHHQLHQFVVFYIATIECILSGIYWTSGAHYPQVDFSLSYFKLWQFVVISHFYWSLATRILHRELLVKHVIDPILAVYVLYFMVIASLGMTDPKSSWVECFEPEWLFLSCAELMAVQLLLVAGIFITKKLNQISSDETFKGSQKRDLWSVIIVYEMSALICAMYDLIMRLFGDESNGCSGIFGHDQRLYSLVYALFMTVKFLLPVWVVLCVFNPAPLRTADQETVFGWSFDGTASSSVFKSTCYAPSCCHHWRFPTAVDYGGQGTFIAPPENKPDKDLPTPALPSTSQASPAKRIQTNLTPITEEDGISESLSSDRSSVPDSGHLYDNQPLLKKDVSMLIGRRLQDA